MSPRFLTPLLLIACGGDAPSPKSDAAPCVPELPSEFDLEILTGTRVIESTSTVPWSGVERSVPVRVYYPTDDTSGTSAKYIDLLEDPHALVDASLRKSECTHPLLVWSHGSQAYMGNGSPLVRQLVADGWVVIAPEHTGNTLIDNWDPRPMDFDMLRVHDVQHALDLVESLPETDPLAGRVDTSRVVVAGHSYGGQTAWLFSGPTFDAETIATRCEESELGCDNGEADAYQAVDDPRVVGVMPLAGSASTSIVAAEGWATVHTPVLYITGSEDTDGKPAFDDTNGHDVTWVEIQGACHESFTFTALTCPGMEDSESFPIVSTYLNAFAWTQVLESDDADLNGIVAGTVSVADPAIAVAH